MLLNATGQCWLSVKSMTNPSFSEFAVW